MELIRCECFTSRIIVELGKAVLSPKAVTRGILWEGENVEGTREKETHVSAISNSFVIAEAVMPGQVVFPEARGWCVGEENGDPGGDGIESKEGAGR